MSVETNMAVLRRFIEEAWNKGNVSVVDDLFSQDYLHHPAYLVDRELRGAEGIKQLINSYRSAFPDIRVTIEDMFGDRDEVVVRMSWYGTHRGQFLSVAPTGRQVVFFWININRFANGKIAETWPAVDIMWALQQLGAAGAVGPTG